MRAKLSVGSYTLPDLGPLEKVRRYLHEEGILKGNVYVNKSSGQCSIALSRGNVEDLRLDKKLGIKPGDKLRLPGMLIESADQFKMLADNHYFETFPILTFKPEKEK